MEKSLCQGGWRGRDWILKDLQVREDSGWCGWGMSIESKQREGGRNEGEGSWEPTWGTESCTEFIQIHGCTWMVESDYEGQGGPEEEELNRVIRSEA